MRINWNFYNSQVERVGLILGQQLIIRSGMIKSNENLVPANFKLIRNRITTYATPIGKPDLINWKRTSALKHVI